MGGRLDNRHGRGIGEEEVRIQRKHDSEIIGEIGGGRREQERKKDGVVIESGWVRFIATT